jgi:hypothetical protein
MPVAPVVAEDQISGLQMGGNRDAGKLLPDAGVHRAEQFTFREKSQQPFFERSDQKSVSPGLGLWFQSLLLPLDDGVRTQNGKCVLSSIIASERCSYAVWWFANELVLEGSAHCR